MMGAEMMGAEARLMRIGSRRRSRLVEEEPGWAAPTVRGVADEKAE